MCTRKQPWMKNNMTRPHIISFSYELIAVIYSRIYYIMRVNSGQIYIWCSQAIELHVGLTNETLRANERRENEKENQKTKEGKNYRTVKINIMVEYCTSHIVFHLCIASRRRTYIKIYLEKARTETVRVYYDVGGK